MHKKIFLQDLWGAAFKRSWIAAKPAAVSHYHHSKQNRVIKFSIHLIASDDSTAAMESQQMSQPDNKATWASDRIKLPFTIQD